MACEGIITDDFLFDCINGAIAGLEVNAVIVNRADIDFSGGTFDAANKLIMTLFKLKAGTTGYLFQGIKQINSSAFELVKKETSLDKKKHIFNGVILSLNAANKLQLEQMSEGGKYCVIVEKKYKGADQADAFDVLGYDSGLELNVATYNSNESDGGAVIELSSPDGYEEPKIPYTLLVADYEGTKTLFDNKFIEAAV